MPGEADQQQVAFWKGIYTTTEGKRLVEDQSRTANWKRWGPYLSERQWATVREDYSDYGTCWEYLPHDQARMRAYRWGEDGLMGFSDRRCRLCFAVALWNEKDPILKERLFGLTGNEGNHGEDAKECWYYLDSTPTHSFARALYKYPQAAFPYGELVEENRNRGRDDPEFELEDTGVFDEDRYFDVYTEYAKVAPDDLWIRVRVVNRGPDPARLHVLPTLWFRNTWSWNCTHEGCTTRSRLRRIGEGLVESWHETLEPFRWVVGPGPDGQLPPLLFTENDTNMEAIHGTTNERGYAKDAFHRYVIEADESAVNPRQVGSKVAAHYILDLQPGEERCLRFRLARTDAPPGFSPADITSVDALFAQREAEAKEFYDALVPATVSPEERNILRQGYAGLLWTKQFYHYIVKDWLEGDPAHPEPPEIRRHGRNSEWEHLHARDILSVPDKWEYPWFAAWDTAFHMIPFAHVDPGFTKRQLSLFLREWYMHPNGQIPAYEFAFDDVNPPVHAWAAWRVYKMTGPRGARDRDFLESVFQKLLLNFTWWVNRKDAAGRNLFSGGFLGLDNIGVFDRSKPLPGGGSLQQADGTAWMAFYCSTMLAMALELARDGDRIRPAYEDMASKFLEHFVQIAEAMNTFGGSGLWDEQDGFYYDQLSVDGQQMPLKTRSLVGLLPLIAVEVLDEAEIDKLPGFRKRLEWFTTHKHDLSKGIALGRSNSRRKLLLAIPTRERLLRVFRYLFDETEFLSPYGYRSLSRHHLENPFHFKYGKHVSFVDYQPGESTSWMFGGNSNWRGPVWFPVNYLLIEALERYHHFYGDEFQVEYPTGSGVFKTLLEIADDLELRLAALFLPDAQGRRPCHGENARYAKNPHWKELVQFHEYFHGEHGAGLGANHQTGWTALVLRCLEDTARKRSEASK
jgi:hypothetical protein